MPDLIYAGFDPILRVLVSTPLLYLAVVAMIRVSGKRTTSQMNNFDWVVTVAMGSLVASGILAKSNAVVTVMVAIATLLVLQYLVTKGVVSSRRIEKFVKAEPRLLLSRGRLLEDAMRAERISDGEVLAAVRDAGYHRLDDVGALVLETDGTFSVLGLASGDATTAEMKILGNVRGGDEERRVGSKVVS